MTYEEAEAEAAYLDSVWGMEDPPSREENAKWDEAFARSMRRNLPVALRLAEEHCCDSDDMLHCLIEEDEANGIIESEVRDGPILWLD